MRPVLTSLMVAGQLPLGLGSRVRGLCCRATNPFGGWRCSESVLSIQVPCDVSGVVPQFRHLLGGALSFILPNSFYKGRVELLVEDHLTNFLGLVERESTSVTEKENLTFGLTPWCFPTSLVPNRQPIMLG